MLLVGTGAFLSRDRPTVPPVAASRPALSVEAEVANQTRGEDTYRTTTTARYDDVVKFSVTLENLGEHPLRGVVPTFRFVDGSGTESHLETRLTIGDFSVIRTTTVDLGRADATLRFIEGSVSWRHQVSQPDEPSAHRTDKLDDASVTSGGSYPLQTLLPGEASSLTLMARMTVPSVGITIDARTSNARWRTDVVAAPGDRVDTRIVVRNRGNVPLRDVAVRVSPAPGLSVQSAGGPGGDVQLVRRGQRSGASAASITTWGVRVGELLPGEVVHVRFSMILSPAVESGAELRTVGVVSSAGLDEYHNVLIAEVS